MTEKINGIGLTTINETSGHLGDIVKRMGLQNDRFKNNSVTMKSQGGGASVTDGLWFKKRTQQYIGEY